MKLPPEDQAIYLKQLATGAKVNPYGNYRDNGNNMRILLSLQTGNKLAEALLAEPEYANDEMLGELILALCGRGSITTKAKEGDSSAFRISH